MPLRPPCPVCGADNALARTGERVHQTPRWLRWARPFMHDYLTRTYLCTQCGATSEMVHVRARGRRSRVARPSRNRWDQQRKPE